MNTNRWIVGLIVDSGIVDFVGNNSLLVVLIILLVFTAAMFLGASKRGYWPHCYERAKGTPLTGGEYRKRNVCPIGPKPTRPPPVATTTVKDRRD